MLAGRAVAKLIEAAVADRLAMSLHAVTRGAGMTRLAVCAGAIRAVTRTVCGAVCWSGGEQGQDGASRQQHHMLFAQFDQAHRVRHSKLLARWAVPQSCPFHPCPAISTRT